ncbi:hypothetical protein [Chlamydia felis Fe/C-56]|uniref:Uncharacterized protein n=1 Tax=Chlamydia felis (strain Fe/C-56) TaxID=264202 RepID=Q254N7_CHLFF|nr:DUF1389 domain-containing protein [Chlamydia felis]BAE81251.1 hypothetical protein [Chlamydia felis Fe/C-56]
MSGIILHSLFRNDCRCHASYSFDKRIHDRVTIAIIMTVISAVSLIIALIPAIIMATPIGFIWAGIFGGIALALFVFAILTNYLRTNIPEGLKKVFKENYPPDFCSFIEKNQLTVQEIRLLLNALEEAGADRDISFHKYSVALPPKLKTALKRYGISEFVDGLEQGDLVSLDSVLIKNCPLYWLRKFIKAAPEFPVRGIIDPSYEEVASYWLGRSGGCRNAGTVFSDNVYFISQKIQKEDFEKLSLCIQSNDWLNEELVAEKHRIAEACLELKKQTLEDNAGIDVANFFKEIENSLLELCTHGVSWGQLNLISSMNSDEWNFLCALDGNKQGVQRFAVPCLEEVSDERHHLYEPMISLVTWRDIRGLGLDVEALLNQQIRDPQDRLVKYFTRQSRYHRAIDLVPKEALERLPRYTLDFSTGNRVG